MFQQIWENYKMSSQLKDHPKRRRTASLLTCFSLSALKVYNSLSFDNEQDRYDINIVLNKMRESCRGVVNKTYERNVFNTRSQANKGSIEEFYGVLLTLSKKCWFRILTSSLTKEWITVEIHNTTTRRKLLSEKGLQLEKCLEISTLV